MKYILLLFLFPFLALSQTNATIASQVNFQLIQADEYIGQDLYNFDYFIKNNTLFKTHKSQIFQYKNVSLGKITRVDIQNPLKIIVFYEKFNTVIGLDNQLNEVQKFNFSEISPQINISCAGIATNNNLWVFNGLNQQLLLYNYVKNSFQTIGLSFINTIKFYKTTYNNFFWITNNNDFYSCDLFGKITFLGKLPSFDLIFIENEKSVVYQNLENLYLFDLEKGKSIPILVVEKSIISFCYKDQNLAIFTNEGITHYKINVP